MQLNSLYKRVSPENETPIVTNEKRVFPQRKCENTDAKPCRL